MNEKTQDPLEVSAEIMAYCNRLALTIPNRAAVHFKRHEQVILGRSLQKCGLTELPEVDGEFMRVDGRVVCPICDQAMRDHPLDWRYPGHSGYPWVHATCEGKLIKL